MDTKTNDEAVAIREAIEFVGYTIRDLETTLEGNLVSWSVRLEGFDYNINGVYEITDKMATRLNVIVSLGLARHKFNQVIFDAVVIAEKYWNTADPSRNSLSQLLMRHLVNRALGLGMPVSRIREWIEQETKLKENIAEIVLIRSIKHTKKN